VPPSFAVFQATSVCRAFSRCSHKAPVLAQPFIDLGERLGAKTVDTPLRLLAELDKPRFPQHPEMPRYPRASNR
jgi:hypothetical protein